MPDLNLPELMHAHPLLTVMVMTVVVFWVFLWSLCVAAKDLPPADDLQQGGDDWMFPPRQKESA